MSKFFLFFLCSVFSLQVLANVVFIVPAGVGTTSDILARKIAEQLQKKTHQTVTLENRPGADQIIALNRVSSLNQPVLFLGGTTLHVFNPVFNAQAVQNLDSTLEVFATVAHGPSVWYANTKSGIESAQDLIQIFQKNNHINVGSDLLSVRINVLSMQQKYSANNVNIVNYKSSSQALIDVSGGVLPVGVGAPTTIMSNLVTEGRIVLLANTTDQAITIGGIVVPPLKNSAQQFSSGWFLSTSKKNPVSAETVKTLQDIVQSTDFKNFAQELGIIPVYQDKTSTQLYIEDYRKILLPLRIAVPTQ